VRRTRHWFLLGLLGLAGAAFALTGKWRGQLLRESARYQAQAKEAQALQEKQRAHAAERDELERQLRDDPADPELRLQLAQVRWRGEGPAAAVAVLDGSPRPLSDVRLARMFAHCSRLIGREDRALAALDEAIGRFPADGNLRADRALLYVLLAWHGEAEQELRAAEARSAADLALVRATLARAKGDLVAARSILQGELSARPGDLELVRQLAALCRDARQYEEAIRLLRSLPESETTAADRVDLATAWAQRADPASLARALEALDRAMVAQPDHPRARLLRARCLRRLGRRDEAERELEALRRDSPRLSGVAYELAEIYRSQRRLAEAQALLAEHRAAQQQRSQLRRAANHLMRDPTDATAHLEVGRLCAARGLYGRAIVELERALKLDLHLSGARPLLARARAEAGRAPVAAE
jgi:predicted Zn-dependent protease